MAITILQQSVIRIFLCLSVIALAACSGGGSGGESGKVNSSNSSNSSSNNSSSSSSSTLADITPDAFTFTAVLDAEPNSENISNEIAVAGIDAAVPISIIHGEYSINGGAYTASTGFVTVNQTVNVKVIAPNGTDMNQTALLNIGGITSNYSVTTFADNQAPLAEFNFPTPLTMSDTSSIKVRGTATDYNAIVSVKVKVNTAEPFDVTPVSDGNYSSWTADIPLTENAENTVVVTTEDEKGNVEDNAAQVVIRQAPLTHNNPFPTSDNGFTSVSGGPVIDYYDGRSRILVLDDQRRIVAVDVASGDRTLFVDLDEFDTTCADLIINPISKRLFCLGSALLEFDLLDGHLIEIYESSLFSEARVMISDVTESVPHLVIASYSATSGGALISFSLDTNTFSLISDELDEPLLKAVNGLTVDKTGSRYLLTIGEQDLDVDAHAVVAIDKNTGNRSIFSSNQVGGGEPFSALLDNNRVAALTGIAINESTQRLYVVEDKTNKLFDIDLLTGDRSIFTSLTYSSVNDTGIHLCQTKIAINEDLNYAVISYARYNVIHIIDLATGAKVILSMAST